VDEAEGRETTLSVVRDLYGFELQMDRLTRGGSEKNHRIVAAHIPMVIHPAVRDVLVIGIGDGQTASRFLGYAVDRLDCVDSEPALVPLVRRYFTSEWLDDPRVSVTVDHGRHYLTHCDRSYDVIALDAEPVSRPGVEALYTLEFYRQARERLNPGGLLTRSLPLAFFDIEQLKSIVATFAEVFPACSLWYNANEPLLIGVNADELVIDIDQLEVLVSNDGIYDDLTYHQWGGNRYYLHEPESFLAGFLSGAETLARLAADAPLLRDDRPVLAYGTRHFDREDVREVQLIEELRDYVDSVDKVLIRALDHDTTIEVTSIQRQNYLDIAAVAQLRRARAIQQNQGNRITRRVFEEIQEALRFNQISVPATRAMGDALRIAGHPDRAEIPYRQAIRQDHNDGLAHLGLGLAYFQQQKVAEALEPLERAVLLRPNDADAHNVLGATLAGLGREQEAAESSAPRCASTPATWWLARTSNA
jgi:spermidine synthase